MKRRCIVDDAMGDDFPEPGAPKPSTTETVRQSVKIIGFAILCLGFAAPRTAFIASVILASVLTIIYARHMKHAYVHYVTMVLCSVFALMLVWGEGASSSSILFKNVMVFLCIGSLIGSMIVLYVFQSPDASANE